MKKYGFFKNFTHSLLPALSFAREVVFPAGCAVCGAALFSMKEAAAGLCTHCEGLFALDESARCSVCGKILISEKEICSSCRKNTDAFAFDRAFTVFPYIGRYKKLLKAYKFGGRKNLAGFFAAKYLQAASILSLGSDVVWVPVPPRAGKIKSSGWDQIEEVAGVLSDSVKVGRCLKRLSSKTQKELSRAERQSNLTGKILSVKKPPENVVLFDDVFTTGSTLSVCASTLKAGGAKRVTGLCLFYG